MNYEIIEDEFGQIIKRTDEDGKIWYIPMDNGNSDYQQYLKDAQADA